MRPSAFRWRCQTEMETPSLESHVQILKELQALHDHNPCAQKWATTICRGANSRTLRLPDQGALGINCDFCDCFPRDQKPTDRTLSCCAAMMAIQRGAGLSSK